MHYDTLFYMSYSPNFEESPLLIQAGNESRPDRRLGTELHRCLALGWKRSRLFPIKVLAFKLTVTTNGALYEFSQKKWWYLIRLRILLDHLCCPDYHLSAWCDEMTRKCLYSSFHCSTMAFDEYIMNCYQCRKKARLNFW